MLPKVGDQVHAAPASLTSGAPESDVGVDAAPASPSLDEEARTRPPHAARAPNARRATVRRRMLPNVVDRALAAGRWLRRAGVTRDALYEASGHAQPITWPDLRAT